MVDWRNVQTFPKHFHNGSEKEVTESHIEPDPQTGIPEFLRFVRDKLNQED